MTNQVSSLLLLSHTLLINFLSQVPGLRASGCSSAGVFLCFSNVSSIAQPWLPGDSLVVCSHLYVLRARRIHGHRGSKGLWWCVLPLEAGLGSQAAPCVPAVELPLVVPVCPWQERRKLTMPMLPLYPEFVTAKERSAHSCGEGSGEMSLAHCTAVPVCGGKSRGLDTKVAVANVLPLISSSLSANRL